MQYIGTEYDGHDIYYETCCIIHQERNLKDFKQVLIQLYFTKNDKRNVHFIVDFKCY